jgi:hypothetical protein
MDNLIRKFKEMEPEQYTHLLSLFLSSVLGSAGTTAFIRWFTTAGVEVNWLGRLFVTLGALLIYTVTVLLIFYIFSPRSRPALRRIFNRED